MSSLPFQFEIVLIDDAAQAELEDKVSLTYEDCKTLFTLDISVSFSRSVSEKHITIQRFIPGFCVVTDSVSTLCLKQ